MKAIFCALVVSLCCTLALGQAQYKVLWTFGGPPNDGAAPVSGLVLDHEGNLYGTTANGGNGHDSLGTIFELSPNADGSWTESVLYNFCSQYVNYQCRDGAMPTANMIFDAQGNLYGTTAEGGSQTCLADSVGCGTVFQLSPPSSPGSAWTETVLYSFCANQGNSTCLDGALPQGPVVFDASGSLYGTTFTGGIGGTQTGCCLGGTVFELSPSSGGWMETVLYNFCPSHREDICPDGTGPVAGVTFDTAGNLYGTTEGGGQQHALGFGTVFKLSPGPNGWTETVLLRGEESSRGGVLEGGVTLDRLGNLYSTFAEFGGDFGGVFRYKLNNRAVITFDFNGTNGSAPDAGVLLDANRVALYGTTQGGGANNYGTVFGMTAPAKETVLYSFCSQPNCADGDLPRAGLIADKVGNLYGTTIEGGESTSCSGYGCGVVFEIVP